MNTLMPNGAISSGGTAGSVQRSGPLTGLRVLELGSFLAGPFASTLLAEMGADVIKVEHPSRPDGLRRTGARVANVDGMGLLWAQEGRNKRFVTCDLSKSAGRELIMQIVDRGWDIVVENFVPGTLERWGLGYEDLQERNEATILARISGYGQTGPKSSEPGYARIAHAYGGLTYLCGEVGGPPLTPGSTSLADYMAGTFAALGVLAAVEERNHSGLGQVIDVSLFEVTLRLMDSLTVDYSKTGHVRGRSGRFTPLTAPHGQFPTADERWVALACNTDQQFTAFCTAVGRPDLSVDKRYSTTEARLANALDLNTTVETITQQIDRERLLEICTAHGVPIGPVNSIGDIFEDDHVRERGSLVTVQDAEWGSLTMPAQVPRFSRTEGVLSSLGAHASGRDNQEVFSTVLGLTEDELDNFQQAQVI